MLPILAPAQALISLTTANVIGGSGQWGGSNWDVTGSGYSALNVVGQQSGAISEPTATGYWLGNNGTANEYFVLDLGATYNLSQIDLYNTHNQNANDRATNAFTIQAANSVSLLKATVDYDLVSGTQILGGTLAFQSAGSDPIEAASYSSGNGLDNSSNWRYLKFTAVSYFSSGAGLNEIRVYGTAIPEPSAHAASAGAAALLLVLFRRRKSGVRQQSRLQHDKPPARSCPVPGTGGPTG